MKREEGRWIRVKDRDVRTEVEDRRPLSEDARLGDRGWMSLTDENFPNCHRQFEQNLFCAVLCVNPEIKKKSSKLMFPAATFDYSIFS